MRGAWRWLGRAIYFGEDWRGDGDDDGGDNVGDNAGEVAWGG